MKMNSDTSTKFYAKLKEKKCANILNEMLSFINITIPDMLEQTEMNEFSKQVQDFIHKCTCEFANIWEIEFPNNKFAYSEILDGFENLVTKSFYRIIMNNLGEDKKLPQLCNKYSFVSFKHLGIDFNVDEFDLANQLKSKLKNIKNKLFLDLSELSEYKAPKEKSTVIVNFCNHICSKYKLVDKSTIIKFLVYSLIKGNIYNLKINLKFTALFRHKNSITSEEDYFLSIFFQAVEFIEKMNYSHLKIKKNEFMEYCEEFTKKELLKNKGKFIILNFIKKIDKF